MQDLMKALKQSMLAKPEDEQQSSEHLQVDLISSWH